MKKIHGIKANPDRIEGRAVPEVVVLAKDRKLAERIVSSKEFGARYGGMGRPGDNKDIVEVAVFDTFAEFLESLKEG